MNKIIWKDSNYLTILTIIIVTILASLMFISFGLVIRFLVDANDGITKDFSAISSFMVFFLIIRLLMPLSYAFIEYLTHSLTINNERKLRRKYFRIISSSNYDSYINMNKGEAQSLFNTALSSVSDYTRIVLSDGFPLLLQTIFVLISTIYYLGMNIGLIFTLLIFVYGYFVIKMTNKRIPMIKRVAISNRKMNGILHENLISMESSKAYNSIANSRNRYKHAIENNIHNQNIVRNEFFKFGALTSIISVVGSAFILLYSQNLIESNKITLGGIIMISTYLFQVFLPLNRIGMLWRQYNRCQIDFSEFLKLINSLELDSDQQLRQATDVKKDIDINIRSLMKNYSKSKVEINESNLTLKNSCINFLIGRNGSGKSTLARILAGVDTKFSGDILINGEMPRHFNTIYMPQEITLINDSIYNNIVHFSNVYSEKKIEDTLNKLGLNKPLGFFVGESGNKLSGGEKQKINLAISFLKKPSLLILDEPTNNIDIESTDQISQFIKNIEESTVLIISHDILFIDSFLNNNVIRMNDGKLLEEVL
ncbi:ATP-binding cassette domain-containing protein [Vibrio mediterranei]